jgi:hypothetical protein
MRRSRLAVLLALILAIGLVGVAQADGITATINRPEASIEDQLLLTVTVEGSRSASPQLPELADFDVYSRGQSTQMSFVNGRVTSSVSYSYVLVPRATGTFTIGAATIELDGEVYSSEPIQVRIVGASERPEETRDVFLSAKVSTTSPYVGQEVIYIWRFYRRVRIGDARLEPQEFQGFLVEDLGEVREYEATVNGVQYLVSEIRKALFPQEEGVVVIPPSRLTVEVLVRSSRGRASAFDSFFGTTASETKTLRTREIELQVRSLPEAPPGFTGLVGDYDIQARISKAELQVGESATLKLSISGSGNVQMIGEPSLPEMPDFKTYDDKPTGSIERSGARLKGSRTYSKALVPLVAGELVVPPIGLTFFDPQAGEFRQIQTAAIPLRVAPREGKEDLNLTEAVAPTTGKVAVRILADDLLPIYKGLDAVQPLWTEGRGAWLFWVGLLAPPVLFGSLWIGRRRRERFALDSALRRRHHALREVRKGLKQIRHMGDSTHEVSQAASRCLREYVGDKLGLEGSALTPTEVEQQLRGRGVAEEWVGKARDLLEQLEAAQYGGEPVVAEDAIARIEDLVKILEKEVRG